MTLPVQGAWVGERPIRISDVHPIARLCGRGYKRKMRANLTQRQFSPNQAATDSSAASRNGLGGLRAEKGTLEIMESVSPNGNKVTFHKTGRLPTQHSTPKSRLERIQDWEALAKDADYDPATMAALCPISLRQLERFFQSNFGKSPRAWVLELQCNRARQLVERGYSNKAIVAELHFCNESHFCNLFKKTHGRSPQSFAPFYGSLSPESKECRTLDKAC
jgi:AraC-like DNA-binding protein